MANDPIPKEDEDAKPLNTQYNSKNNEKKYNIMPGNVEIGVNHQVRYIPSPLSNSPKDLSAVKITDHAEDDKNDDSVQIIVPVNPNTQLLQLSNLSLNQAASSASHISPRLDPHQIQEFFMP